MPDVGVGPCQLLGNVHDCSTSLSARCACCLSLDLRLHATSHSNSLCPASDWKYPFKGK